MVSTKHVCIQRTSMSILIYNGLQCWSLPCTVTYSSGQLWKQEKAQTMWSRCPIMSVDLREYKWIMNSMMTAIIKTESGYVQSTGAHTLGCLT